jgi:hypothetical protein
MTHIGATVETVEALLREQTEGGAVFGLSVTVANGECLGGAGSWNAMRIYPRRSLGVMI